MAFCHWLRLLKNWLWHLEMLGSKTDLNTAEAHSQVHIPQKIVHIISFLHIDIEAHVTDLWVNVFEHSWMWRLKTENLDLIYCN